MAYRNLTNGTARSNQQKMDVILDSAGLPVGFSSEFGDRTIVATFIDCATSRSLTFSDVENIVRTTGGASAVVLTVESDVLMGIDSKVADIAHTIGVYQRDTGAASFAAGAGVTIRGTAPAAAQYSTVGLMHVGANEWAYL